jgi:hypothetical protein
MTDEATSPAGDRSIDVVRDVTFTRFYADEAVMAVVGRDLEVGFLQYGPIFTQQIDRGDQEETVSRNVVTEVARMRMDYPTFLRTTMEFIEQGIMEGRIKADAVLQSIAEWEAKAPSAQGYTPRSEQ